MFKNAQFFLDEDRQILFIKHFTKLSKKTRILDLGYGRGYHLEEIQKISNFAFGFDKVCDSILPNTTKLDFFQADWNLENLDCIYCLAPEFGTDWQNFNNLAVKISNTLSTGGKFIFDHFNYNSLPISKSWKDFANLSERIVLSKYTREENRMICERTIINKNFEKKNINLEWRIFERDELINIMRKAGLELEGEYKNFYPDQVGSWTPTAKPQRLTSVWIKK